MTRSDDARQAWRDAVAEMGGFGFDSQQDAFCDGYETALADSFNRCKCRCHNGRGEVKHVAACCCSHRFKRNCPHEGCSRSNPLRERAAASLRPEGEPQ